MLSRLQFSPLFKGLEKDEIKELLSGIIHNIKNYSKGGMIVSQGEKCESLLIILKGKVTAEMLEENGNSLQVDVLKSHSILAPAFMFGSRSVYPVSATATADTTVLSLPKESLLQLISSNQKIMINYLNILNNKVQFLTERIRLFSMKTIKQKSCSYFLERLPKDSDTLKMDRTQKELAEFLSVSRPALARVLGEMKDEKLIEQISNKIMRIKKKEMQIYLKGRDSD